VDVSAMTGDYVQSQLADKMGKLEIIGDIISDYKKISDGKKAICFCVTVEHSMKMAIEFNRAGYPAIHCDESTNQKDRDIAIGKFRRGEYLILCNVNIFSTGVDIPEAEVGIMARPTRSEILYIQQVGRIFRPCRICGKCKTQYDNSPYCPRCGYDKPMFIKKEAIIIDSGNNHSRFGHPYDVRMAEMDEADSKRKEKKEKPISKICTSCFFVYDAYLKKCPNCSTVDDLPKELYKTKAGIIVPYDEFSYISSYFRELERKNIIEGRKPHWKHFKLYEKFGDQCMKYRADFDLPIWLPQIYAKSQAENKNKKYFRG
jgi:hypothetical protein